MLSRKRPGAKKMPPFTAKAWDDQRFHAFAANGGSPRPLSRAAKACHPPVRGHQTFDRSLTNGNAPLVKESPPFLAAPRVVPERERRQTTTGSIAPRSSA